MKPLGSTPILLLVTALWAAVGIPAFGEETGDSVTEWTRWKSIEAATALRTLDGPEDIIEKAEIIEDRSDDLALEKDRLDGETARGRERLEHLRNQRRVLRELEELRLSSDPRSRQRLQDITERIRREESLIERIGGSMAGLEAEQARMGELAAVYREKARLLRIKEGGTK